MSNNLDEILSLTKEISFQDSEDIDITVTEYGEKLSETDDIEFLRYWFSFFILILFRWRIIP